MKTNLIGRVTVIQWISSYTTHEPRRVRAEKAHPCYWISGVVLLDGKAIALVGHSKRWNHSRSKTCALFTTRAPFRKLGVYPSPAKMMKAAFALAKKKDRR